MRKLAVIIVFLLAGCGYDQGLLRDSITQVQVNRANFRMAATNISASVTTTRLFCAIPIASENIMKQLMQQLHEKANLRAYQMFINFRQDISLRSFLFLTCKFSYVLSADVIEFLDSQTLKIQEQSAINSEMPENQKTLETDKPVSPPAMSDLPSATVPVSPVSKPAPAPSPEPAQKPNSAGKTTDKKNGENRNQASTALPIPTDGETEPESNQGNKPKKEKRKKQVVEPDPIR